ncbi:hypothetical protein ABZ626_37345 [Streptomyces longispororuber]|uniref:hypothetical protein n=1 Tax=Streptomyces longispororuber TaxID=68230 RepID=UPI0033EC7EB5
MVPLPELADASSTPAAAPGGPGRSGQTAAHGYRRALTAPKGRMPGTRPGRRVPVRAPSPAACE